METKNLLAIDEAVIYLNSLGYPIKKSSLYKLTSTGKIPFLRFGGKKVVFRPDTLEAWAEGQLTDPTAEMEGMKKRVAQNARNKEKRA